MAAPAHTSTAAAATPRDVDLAGGGDFEGLGIPSPYHARTPCIRRVTAPGPAAGRRAGARRTVRITANCLHSSICAYSGGDPAGTYIGGPTEIGELYLKPDEKADLEALLKTLTDEPLPGYLIVDTHDP